MIDNETKVKDMLRDLVEHAENLSSSLSDIDSEVDTAYNSCDSARYYIGQADDQLDSINELLNDLQNLDSEFHTEKLVKTLENVLEMLKQ
jgi:hypothetical protein